MERFKLMRVHQPTFLQIIVDTSDETCSPFGFLSGDKVSYNGSNREIAGVAPDNNGVPSLWYILDNPSAKGRIATLESRIKNLKEVGFVLEKAREFKKEIIEVI